MCDGGTYAENCLICRLNGLDDTLIKTIGRISSQSKAIKELMEQVKLQGYGETGVLVHSGGSLIQANAYALDVFHIPKAELQGMKNEDMPALTTFARNVVRMMNQNHAEIEAPVLNCTEVYDLRGNVHALMNRVKDVVLPSGRVRMVQTKKILSPFPDGDGLFLVKH